MHSSVYQMHRRTQVAIVATTILQVTSTGMCSFEAFKVHTAQTNSNYYIQHNGTPIQGKVGEEGSWGCPLL